MTSLIQKACCCGEEDSDYVEFKLPPRCTDKSLGCDCGSDDPYEYRSTAHGCGAVDPRSFECTSTGETDCPEPGSDDCSACGAVYMQKDEFLETVLHVSDGVTWNPSRSEIIERIHGWWQAGGGLFTTEICTGDDPETTRISRWDDSSACTNTYHLNRVSSTCFAPGEMINTDSRNPLDTGTILSTAAVGGNNTLPRDMSAGNISELNVTSGDAWFAITFRVESGATTGRRRIFDQGDTNFGLILDGTTLKACFGSEANSAQEASLSTGVWHTVVAQRSGGTVTARLNGSDFSTNSVSNSDNIASTEPFRINRIVGTDQARFRGQYGDLIVASGSLDTEDVERMEGYLAHRFNIESSLPSSHPYRNDVPQITDMTPRAFNFALSGHIFKIDLNGKVVPCQLSGTSCVGPGFFSISNDCTVIGRDALMKDCAGNIMFYGPQHPSSVNHFPGSPFVFPGNPFEWACALRFWTDTTNCPTINFCPQDCTDPDAEYADNLLFVSSEWAKGLWHRDCDTCENCDPIDATNKVLLTDETGCQGGKSYTMGGGVEWQDPFNALFGLANYTNQTRCSQELDGMATSDCCGQDGDRDAPFLDQTPNSLGPDPACSATCFDLNDLQSVTTDAPYDTCLESEAGGAGNYCNTSGTVNSCCLNNGQDAPSSYTVNIPEYFLDSDTFFCGGGSGCSCEVVLKCSTNSVCGDTFRCRADQITCPNGLSSQYCGCNDCGGSDPDDFCPCCESGPNPPDGCPGCPVTGYQVNCDLTGRGFNRVPSFSVVVSKLATDVNNVMYLAQGVVGVDRGFVVSTEISAATIGSACAPAGCPDPENLDCPERAMPLRNGITRVQLACFTNQSDIQNNWPRYYEVGLRYIIFQRDPDEPEYVGPCAPEAGSFITVKYRKLATSLDPTGTYTLVSPGGFPTSPPYPATITVS